MSFLTRKTTGMFSMLSGRPVTDLSFMKASYTGTADSTTNDATGNTSSIIGSGKALDTEEWGLRALVSNLTINSTTVAPKYIYSGVQALGGEWPARAGGVNLNLVNTGSVPNLSQSTPYIDTDDAVNFVDARVYQADAVSDNQIGTGDFVIEVIFRHFNDGSDRAMVSTQDTGSVQGLSIFQDGAGDLRVLWNFHDGTGSVNGTTSTYTDAAFHHFMIFADRDESGTNGANSYIDGGNETTGEMSARTASLTSSADKFTIGSAPDFSSKMVTGQQILWVACWESASWFAGTANNSTDWTAIASSRYNLLKGGTVDVSTLSTTVPEKAVGPQVVQNLIEADNGDVVVNWHSDGHDGGSPRDVGDKANIITVARRASGGTSFANLYTDTTGIEMPSPMSEDSTGDIWLGQTIFSNTVSERGVEVFHLVQASSYAHTATPDDTTTNINFSAKWDSCISSDDNDMFYVMNDPGNLVEYAIDTLAHETTTQFAQNGDNAKVIYPRAIYDSTNSFVVILWNTQLTPGDDPDYRNVMGCYFDPSLSKFYSLTGTDLTSSLPVKADETGTFTEINSTAERDLFPFIQGVHMEGGDLYMSYYVQTSPTKTVFVKYDIGVGEVYRTEIDRNLIHPWRSGLIHDPADATFLAIVGLDREGKFAAYKMDKGSGAITTKIAASKALVAPLADYYLTNFFRKTAAAGCMATVGDATNVADTNTLYFVEGVFKT